MARFTNRPPVRTKHIFVVRHLLQFKSNPCADFHSRAGLACYNRRMIDTITNASGGLRNAAAAFENAAKNVVKAAAPESKTDLPTAIVDSKTSEIAFKANLATFKAAGRMMGTLLDTIA